jgi:hypothetical protein
LFQTEVGDNTMDSGHSAACKKGADELQNVGEREKKER